MKPTKAIETIAKHGDHPLSASCSLHTPQIGDRPFVLDVAGIERGFWFKQDDMRFFLSDWAVLNAFGYDEKFARLKPYLTIPQFEQQSTFDYQKQFVFLVVFMPNELTFELGKFYVGVVQFTGDLGTPILLKQPEFLRQVYLLHKIYPSTRFSALSGQFQ